MRLYREPLTGPKYPNNELSPTRPTEGEVTERVPVPAGLTLEAVLLTHHAFASAESMPAEIVATAQYHVGETCALFFGAGAGLDAGYGLSVVRPLAGLSCGVGWGDCMPVRSTGFDKKIATRFPRSV